MTQQDSKEYNLRCLRFLGIEIDDVNWCEFEKRLPNPITGYYAKRHHTEQLCFHLEWAWIHLVIEMIEKLGYFVMINRWTSIYTGVELDRIIVTSVEGQSKLVNTVQAINQFLIWNENKI